MNILFIEHFFVGIMVSEIPRVDTGYSSLYNIKNMNEKDYNKRFIKEKVIIEITIKGVVQ